MIRAAILVDIRGPKTMAALNLTQNTSYEPLISQVLEKYYELVDIDGIESSTIPIVVNNCHVCFSSISESLIIIGIPNEEFGDLDGHDMEAITAISDEMRRSVQSRPPSALKEDFIQTSRRHIQKTIRICMITSESYTATENEYSQVLTRLMLNLGSFTGPYSRPISIGSYMVEICRQNLEELARELWPIHLMHAKVFALFIEPNSNNVASYSAAVATVRSNSDSPVLAVVLSDVELEYAKEVADELRLKVCQIDSRLPSSLLLTILHTAGHINIPPDLARSKWSIDTTIDRHVVYETPSSTPKGHQAFVVVDRATGEPLLSYYYDKKSKVLERAYNLVAAISSFNFEDMIPANTSVFNAGDLNYIMIERDQLVFALITGDTQDVETLRTRFSFLPDLYFDEMPGSVGPLDSPYASPPFILKLLATIPPVELSPRHVPFKIREPEWSEFAFESVRDLLEAVWTKIDNVTELSQFIKGNGPHLALGAIHLLKSLGAIGFKINVQLTDIPYVVQKSSEDVLRLYEGSEEILELCGGMLTIEEIASVTGVDPRVLLVVISELYKRGQINFVES